MPPEDQNPVATFLRQALADAGAVEDHLDPHFLPVPGGGSRVQVEARRALPLSRFHESRTALPPVPRGGAQPPHRAPLYVAARRITREPDGALVFDGSGDLVDAVVEMRRFPDADLLDAMALDGRLRPSHIEDLAHALAAFHAEAEIFRRAAGPTPWRPSST